MQEIKFGVAWAWSFVFGPVLGGVFGIGGLFASLAGSPFSIAEYPLSAWFHVAAIVVGCVMAYPAMIYCEIFTFGKDPEVRAQRIREDLSSW